MSLYFNHKYKTPLEIEPDAPPNSEILLRIKLRENATDTYGVCVLRSRQSTQRPDWRFSP